MTLKLFGTRANNRAGENPRKPSFPAVVLLSTIIAAGCGFSRRYIEPPAHDGGREAQASDAGIDVRNLDGGNACMPSPTARLKTSVLPLGLESAPVKIMLVQDFQGPFDLRLAVETLPQIRTNYVDQGKVQFQHVDMPLVFHPNAEDAAVAARVANVFRKFWEMRGLLFERQAEWADLATADAREKFIQYAESIGINRSDFLSFFGEEGIRHEVRENFMQATAYCIQGVPTSVILIPKNIVEEAELRRLIIRRAGMGIGEELREEGENFATLVIGAWPANVFTEVLDLVR